jgi:hypothetical protein
MILGKWLCAENRRLYDLYIQRDEQSTIGQYAQA